MTIAAAFLTSEGVVFGADSTTTFTLGLPGPDQKLKFYNNAQKVFQIGQPGEARFGLCTWGDGRIGQQSHRSVVARLMNTVGKSTTVKDITDALISILNEPDSQVGRASVGYLIGGVDQDTCRAACSQVVAVGGNAPVVIPLNPEDACFAGAPRFFTRVERGYDPELPALLTKHLRSKISTLPADFDKIAAEAIASAAAELPGYVSRGLPLRDAIDFIHTYLHLTIKAHKFMTGPTICGGAIEMGFISIDRPFRWIRHKPFDSAIDEVL